jgi:OmpA-OmpF porin, OOP family
MSSSKRLRALAGLALILLGLTSRAAAQVEASAAASVSTEGAAPNPKAEPPAAPADDAPATSVPFDLTRRPYNSWYGPSGGLFVIDPRVGEVGAVRLQLGMSLFSDDDVLLDKDHVEQDEQSLSVGVTATKVLEFYANLQNRSTASTKPSARSLANMGELSIGGKVGGEITPVLFLGGDLRIAFANQVGGGGSTLGATSIGVRADGAIDLQHLPEPVPFVARLNLGYYFDNTSKLVKELEDSRYAAINGEKNAQADETRHLIDRFERLAMNINRFDRLTLGVGFETPLTVVDGFFLHPLLEWRVDVPVNRQDFDCAFVSANKQSGTLESAEDSCYERTSGSAFPMNLALGVRAVPPIRGVSILLGADFGLNGTSKFVRELAPTLPYRLMLALSYDYDARPVEPVVVQAPVVEPPPPPPTGRVRGTVTSNDGVAIGQAVVAFAAHDVSAVATSSDGHFVSESFAPGEVQLEVSHADHEPGTCAATVPEAGGDVEVTCTLTPRPRTGELRGRVLDVWGSPVVGVRVMLSGPSSLSATSDIRGSFELSALGEGDYDVRTESTGYFVRVGKVSVKARQASQLDVTVMPKPTTPTVKIAGTSIQARSIKFEGESTEFSFASAQSVAELADLLLSRPELRIRVQGYGKDTVSLSRGLLIKQRLVDAGVAESRVEASSGATGRVAVTILP